MKHIVITKGTELLRVPVSRLMYISSDGNYSHVVTQDGKERLVSLQLGQIEDIIGEQLGDTGALSLALGAILATGMYMLGDNGWSGFVWKWYGIYESLLCVFISFGLIWFFRQCFASATKFSRWCAEQSYGAYVFHLLIMLGIQFATDDIWMGAVGKFLFIGVSTTIVSFVLTWLLRMIPGVKKVL